MDAPCYCTNHGSETQFLDQASSSMELDSALHELGMLSSVTDSRINYLKANMGFNRRQRSSNSFSSAPVCIVQMNSKFVTRFSLTKKIRAAEEESRENELKISDVEDSAEGSSIDKASPTYFKPRDSMTIRRRKRRRSRMVGPYDRTFEPYDFPWRSKLEDSLRNIPASTAAVVTERASSPVMSRQDSGNKSNPSSPVKSQNSLTSSGSSIVRSRSLDDLEISKLEDCKEDSYSGCYSGRSDIDNVSQRISKLHVS